MSTITKQDFVDGIVEKTQAKQTLVKAVVHNFLDEIISELAKGNRLEFRDFGVFEVRVQAARKAKNPKTLESVDVPPRRRVKFKMGRRMKQKLNSQVQE
jgi:integration host factor subunit beta